MLDLPASTLYDRRVPKQKFYDNLEVTPKLKRIIIEQLHHISWRNKIASATVNVAVGNNVTEIEVFEITLNQRGLDKGVLQLIDREIPYHILFLLAYKGEVQAWIGYKEESQTKSGTFKPGTYYNTEWKSFDDLTLKLDGLTMDAVYENFIRQIAGDRLAPDETQEANDIRVAIDRDEQRQRLERDIATMESRVLREKQFNRQVELNGELKRLREDLEGLG